MSLITEFFTPKASDDLSLVLDDLAKHGLPRISKYRNGWLTSVAIEDASQGRRVDITSDYHHSSPLRAAEECRTRLLNFIEPKN